MGKMMAGLTNAGVQNGDGQTSYPGSPAATAQTLAKDSAATLQPGSAQVDGSADNSDFGIKLNDPTTQGAQPKLAPGMSYAQASSHPSQLTTKGKVLSMLLTGLQGAAAGDAAARTGDPRHGYAGLGAAGLAGLNVPFQNQERANMLQQQEGQNQIQQAQLQSLPLQRQLQAATLQKEQAETINKGYIPTKTGGVLDLKTKQLVPGTEPTDKNGTVENAIAARAKEVQDAGGDVNADPKIQQLIGLQKQAQKPPAGDEALGSKVDQLNGGLAQRYQVLNPGKPLPAALTLPPNATSKDFDRIDKIMQQTETAQGTKAQQQTANAMRQQAGALAQGAKADARLDSSYKYTSGELSKISTPLDARAQRMSTLLDTINQKTPQADSLVAPELLTVMAGGQGSGLRMNEAEISRIVGGRSNWESIKAAANKWQADPSKALSITDAQRGQIKNLLSTVQSKINQKQGVVTKAQQDLIDAPDVTTHRKTLADVKKQLADVDSGKTDGGTSTSKGGGFWGGIPGAQPLGGK